MSERVVEMIEALQKDWRSRKGWNFFGLPSEGKDTLDACTEQLAPVLSAARAQEKELAALKEPKCPICGKKLLSGISWCFSHASPHAVPSVECECGYCNAAICADDKHSADLREIAEMAINKQNVADHDAVHVGCDAVPCSLMEKLRKVRLIADSIVREFREKKAKVGK